MNKFKKWLRHAVIKILVTLGASMILIISNKLGKEM